GGQIPDVDDLAERVGAVKKLISQPVVDYDDGSRASHVISREALAKVELKVVKREVILRHSRDVARRGMVSISKSGGGVGLRRRNLHIVLLAKRFHVGHLQRVEMR